MEELDFDDNLDGEATLPPGADEAAAQEAVKMLLIALGEDPERQGLEKTPMRAAHVPRAAERLSDEPPGADQRGPVRYPL